MKREELLERVCLEIYTQMYKEADPPLDFQQILTKVNDGKQMPQDWFLKYYLNEERQQEIIKEISEKYKLKRYEKRQVSVTTILGCSPRGSK